MRLTEQQLTTGVSERLNGGARSERAPVAVAAEGLTLDYGSRRAVDEVTFSLEQGQILCLLGSSGSGKSSVLRLLAGLERPTAGTIRLCGEPVAVPGLFVEPHRRQVGMVFQDFALFPHLTAFDNIAFGLRGRDRGEVERVVRGLLEDIGLSDRAASYPHMLSGGERQRVALARALAPKPGLLLMDEPFSSLDTELREHIRAQTVNLIRRRGMTSVLVTHDPSEALRVADRVGVLSHGRLVQFGTPAEIYERPCSPQLACALGAVNRLEARLEDGVLHTPIGVFAGPPGVPPGPVTVCIRPQHVSLCRDNTGVRAHVTSAVYAGDAVEVQLRVNDVPLVVRVSSPSAVGIGDAPHVRINPEHLLVFPMRGDSMSPAA